MYINDNTTSQQINRNEAEKQLDLLGFTSKGKVFIRAFPSEKSTNKTAKKANIINWKNLEEWQREGKGIYLVVNGGGHTDSEVTEGRAIFCEHDNLSKAIQLKLWQELNLPEPTFQIDTGGKSIHSYWVFEKPIDIASWKQLQSDLLDFTDADRTIKNPSRVMRLAGAWHSSGNQSLIVSASEKKYTFEQLRGAIPTPQKIGSNPVVSRISSSEEIPLQQFLTRDDRQLIDSGATSRRNENGAKLARNLLGTAVRLDYLGLKYTPSPRELFDDYCRRCISGNGWNEREWDSIWKSAQKANPTASLTDDALENCAKAWQHNQQKSQINHLNYRANYGNYSNDQPSTKVVTHPSFAQPNIKEIGVDIDKLITQDLRRSDLLIAFSELAQKYKMAEAAIGKIYYTRIEELDKEDARGDVKAEIEALLAAQRSSLNLSEILPTKLAAPIEKLASILNLKPECFLIALLTQASAMFKVGTETMLFPQSKYRCTPNYFGSIVAEISQKKSPIFRAMITDPMLPILQMAREEHKQKLEEYEADLAEWKAKKDNRGAEPIKPRPRVYSFSKATGESIPYQVQQFPLQSLLWTCDELAGLLKSGNQYRGGKGSDEEDLLEYWNGGSTGVRVLRSDGMRTDLDRLSLSIFGTIQPAVLAEFLSRGDNNGKFARFDFVLQPLAACELAIDMPTVDLSPMLTALYSKIDRLPPINFNLSLEARRRFIEFYNQCERRRIKESDPAIAGMIGKSPEKVGKLLTCIHAIHSLFDGDEISPTIETEAVLAAIKFVQFAEAQIRSIRTEIGDRHEIAPNLARMIQTIARKGIATVRDVVNGFSSKNRPSFSLAKAWLQELLSLGYVVPVSEGKFTLTEKCGYSGYNLSNSYSESDTAVATSGYESPDLATNNKNQSPESPAVARLVATKSIDVQGMQPLSPESPEKIKTEKNANAEIADSVTVGTTPSESEPITDIASLSPGDKIVTAAGIELAEVDAITKKQWIYIKVAESDKPMIEKALPKAKWGNDVLCVTQKDFKEWADVMRLRVRFAPVKDEPSWQPGQKLKLRIPGQMQGDVVELVGYKYTKEGILQAIVNWLGKQQVVALDKLSEAT